MAYYTEWDSEIHLTAFGKRLDDDQIRIVHFGITISDEEKLQFYLEQMYASNHFNKKEMTEWENKSITIKDNFDKAKLYFEGLVKDYKVYAQNSNGTSGKHNFESTNQATKADVGDELQQYIAKIVQAAVTKEEQAANIRDSSKASSDTMAAQIKTMSDQIAQLAKAMANKENTPNGSGGGGSGSGGGGGGGGLRESGQGRVAINTKSHKAWAATVSCTVSIQPARTTQAPTAKGNSQTTTSRQRGTTRKVAACTGHHPFASALGNRTTQPTQASQHQQTDRDQGRIIANQKRKIAKQKP